MASFDEITGLLQASRASGNEAVPQLMRAIYEDLRCYTRAALARRQGGVDPTGIVHEAYVKLVSQERASYEDRRHFFAVAAQAVRRILIDHARRDGAEKRGGAGGRTTLDTRHLGVEEALDVDVLDLHEALEALAREEPRAARLVELRFFGGLTNAEAAEELGVSVSTANLDWRYARAWLYRHMG